MPLNYDKNDPFRPADNWTKCPKCGEAHGWNDEDGLEEQQCVCGYQFQGYEPPAAKSTYPAVQTEIHKQHLQRCLDGNDDA